MDGRFLILAIRDDCRKKQKCGHGWLLRDLGGQGPIAGKSKSAALDGCFVILAIRDDRRKNQKCGHG